MINYSFIIPHHNNPELLNRCLDSIPQRDDIEIIVVDDNSDADKRPYVTRTDVRQFFIDAEHSKGAGRARNYGMAKAKGNWLVFADSDDFFVPNFIRFFDKYVNSDFDVVYYDAKGVDTYTLKEMSQLLRRQNSYFYGYDGSKKAEEFIRFKIHSPWWKFVKRDFVEKNQIQFEEVPKGNDIFYTFQVGFFAKKIAVERKQLYVYTYNPNGISNGKKNEIIYQSVFGSKMKIMEFYRFIGHNEWVHSNIFFLLRIIKHDGFFIFLKTLFCCFVNYRKFRTEKMAYVDSIKNRM